jgi:phage replication-related protein YjqB (UPF0714/DUF867 family)
MNFSELLAFDGVEEHNTLRGTFGFMAFHGGELEELTDVIASIAAERAGASYYGVTMPDNLEWHIPSHKVTADQSPVLESFLSHVDTVITVHGFGRQGYFTSLLLGGRNRRLATHMAQYLRHSLPEYTIIDDIDAVPKDLRGMHQDNPVNVPLHAGVQLELPPRVRGSSPIWKDWTGPGLVPHTERLIDALVNAATTWRTLTDHA